MPNYQNAGNGPRDRYHDGSPIVGHTKGPWQCGNNVVFGPEGEPIARIHMPTPDRAEREANSKLISAAPDLLEACEDALYYVYKDGRTHSADGKKYGYVEALEMAIAKAKGE